MFSFEVCTVDAVEKIFVDLKASKESVETGVQYLIEWLKQEPHLPNVTDKEFLTIFLIGSKNSLEKAKYRLNKYYINKAQMPEIYMNRDPTCEEFKRCMRTMYLIPLPKITPDRYRVVIHGFGVYNPEDVPTATDVLRLYSTMMDVNTKTDLVGGYIAIYDCANISISLHKLLLSLWASTAQLMQNSAPVRLHKIYLLNLSSIIQFFIDTGLRFLGEKLSSRVIIWKKNPKDLTEIFSKEILPVEYGGTEKSVDELKDNTLKRLIFYRDWLKSIEDDKADLKKIPHHSSSKDILSLSKMQGSFRKLSFD